jgi:hypothetical protein
MSICFIAGGIAKALQVTAFTLAWTHSVQKTEWQEDWQVSAAGLALVEARIKSSGAGVDPPPDARLVDGWWRWQPAPVSRSEVVLAHSGAAGDWRICVEGACIPLQQTIAIEAAGPVTMRPCPEK